MIKVPFRAVLISLIAIVAVGGLVVPNLQNGPTKINSNQNVSTNGACTNHGITLIVDFGKETKLEPIQKCVVAEGLSGWQVLQHAGLQVFGTAEYPNSFVCRINDWPSQKIEDCAGTPGLVGGSWVYFYSKPGSNGWLRSPVGAATRKPICGEVEGWLFVNRLADDQKFASPKIYPNPFSCR
jgi:hypothetical protein